LSQPRRHGSPRSHRARGWVVPVPGSAPIGAGTSGTTLHPLTGSGGSGTGGTTWNQPHPDGSPPTRLRLRRLACRLPFVHHHRPAPMLATVLASLVALAGCKRSADEAHQDEHHHEWNLPPVDATVKVSLDGKSIDVTLSSLAADRGGSVSF